MGLVEKGNLGGTCLHRGCIPTKALLHAAEVADSAKESEAYGVRATFEGIDIEKVYGYRDGVIGRLYKGLQGLVKSRNVTFIEGAGTLMRPSLMLGLLVYSPLLTRMITNISAMGLSEEKLHIAIRRFDKAGERSRNTRRCTLPVVVMGRASMNSISLGYS